MAAGSFSAVRRRNVSPTSSTLKVQTRDVDCSGLAVAPEDGEFITMQGTSPAGGANDFSGANVGALNAGHHINGASLVMVWGSAQRSDRQALGDSRVATLAHGGIEVQCSLYEAADTGAALDAAANFPVGIQVTVADNTQDLSVNAAGSTAPASTGRLVLAPLAEGTAGWAVGYVTASDNRVPAADRPITVYLYDKPRLIAN